jgi:hypothetical protein
MPPRLSFAKIGPESEEVLRHLFQHYLRDMAEWFKVETNPDGSYAYDISAIWRKATRLTWPRPEIPSRALL